MVSFSKRRSPSRCQPCQLRLPSVSALGFRSTRRSPVEIVNCRRCLTLGRGIGSSTETILQSVATVPSVRGFLCLPSYLSPMGFGSTSFNPNSEVKNSSFVLVLGKPHL